MSKLVHLLSITFLIHAYLMASCTFLAAGDPLLGTLEAAYGKALEEKAAKLADNKKSPVQEIDLRLLNICTTPRKRVKLVGEVADTVFLGDGAFATVSSATLGGEKSAVKTLSLDLLLFNEFEKDFLIDDEATEAMVEGILEELSATELLRPPSEASGDRLLETRLLLEQLGQLPAVEFYAKQFEPGFLAGFLAKHIKVYWELLVQEVELNESIRDALADTPSSAVEYKGCYIDSRLNTYIVMQQLGLSVFDARSACATPLRGNGFPDQVARYLRMFLTAAEFQKAGVNICDIKLENLMLGRDFDPRMLYFTDFGLSVKERACKGGSRVFAPPEAFHSEYQNTPHTTRIKFGSVRVVNQFDAYSLGLALSGLELDHDQFVTVVDWLDKHVGKILKAEHQARIGAKERFAENPQVEEDLLADLGNEFPAVEQPPAENLEKISALTLESLKKMAGKSRDAIKTALDADVSTIVDGNANKQKYARVVQRLINHVIHGLLDPEVESRLSVSQALYLFILLGRLTDPGRLDFGDAAKTALEIDTLECAEALFVSAPHMRVAMSGNCETPQFLVQHVTKFVTDPELRGIILAGDYKDERLDGYHQKTAQILGLIPRFALPKYEKAVGELKSALKDIKTELLI